MDKVNVLMKGWVFLHNVNKYRFNDLSQTVYFFCDFFLLLLWWMKDAIPPILSYNRVVGGDIAMSYNCVVGGDSAIVQERGGDCPFEPPSYNSLSRKDNKEDRWDSGKPHLPA